MSYEYSKFLSAWTHLLCYFKEIKRKIILASRALKCQRNIRFLKNIKQNTRLRKTDRYLG